MPAPAVAVLAAVAEAWQMAPPALARLIATEPDWADWYGRQLEMWHLEAEHYKPPKR
jgi:hypothetical protein